ncbi:OsmC family peroxiredoxin [Bacillus mangrovi]|uniref:OsmC family peroxiredoxin n=1 Tax=Metabacillus mangrovi TaxID=1491830 RepID=A0A7X2S274_9BACI|nr:OsmC family protein [Metabacillus mangrovi]MTH51896.1 OsmC family peroxiredoxin [Metabacillus mangrovi]
MKTTVAWDGNLSFGGLSPSGHEIKMDAGQESGGVNSGPRPTELLLHAVAGCTGIDIILILKKMRLEPVNFQMEVEGVRAEDHPKRFTNVHIHYVLEGDLPEEKVAKAVKLSVDKYCSVSHSLNAEIKVTCSINGKAVEGLEG